MISNLEELNQANALVQDVKKGLQADKVKFDKSTEVGIMIEIPSAALVSDILADHCDFFSIGTNDLMQYMLAVDRGNERLAHLYEPGHPALHRFLKLIVDNSSQKKQPVSICGELAGDSYFIPLLIGLGLRSLSVSPNFVPSIKHFLRNVSVEEVEALAEEVLGMSDADAIIERLKGFYESK